MPWPPRHKVLVFNFGALNCCLTFKFFVCIERYVQKSKIKKKSKMTEKIKFSKNFRNLRHFFVITTMSAIRPKLNILISNFFANTLIFMVLIDFEKNTLGYRRFWGVTFQNIEFFRFLWSPPPKKKILFGYKLSN